MIQTKWTLVSEYKDTNISEFIGKINEEFPIFDNEIDFNNYIISHSPKNNKFFVVEKTIIEYFKISSCLPHTRIISNDRYIINKQRNKYGKYI